MIDDNEYRIHSIRITLITLLLAVSLHFTVGITLSVLEFIGTIYIGLALKSIYDSFVFNPQNDTQK